MSRALRDAQGPIHRAALDDALRPETNKGRYCNSLLRIVMNCRWQHIRKISDTAQSRHNLIICCFRTRAFLVLFSEFFRRNAEN